MALIVSPVASKWSGSIAGLTLSHNKGGMYIRARAKPTNPATVFQQAVRNSATSLTARWSNTLTQAQRDAWAVYAANVSSVNKVGNTINLTPLDQYVKSNIPRQQAAKTTIDAGPSTFVLPTFTAPTLSIVGATDIVSIAFTNTDGWAALGGGLLIYISRPQSAGISYFKGPYRFLGVINGAAVPPTSPATFTSPFDYATGNAAFFQVRCSNPDARLSSPQRFRAIAT